MPAASSPGQHRRSAPSTSGLQLGATQAVSILFSFHIHPSSSGAPTNKSRAVHRFFLFIIRDTYKKVHPFLSLCFSRKTQNSRQKISAGGNNKKAFIPLPWRHKSHPPLHPHRAFAPFSTQSGFPAARRRAPYSSCPPPAFSSGSPPQAPKSRCR